MEKTMFLLLDELDLLMTISAIDKFKFDRLGGRAPASKDKLCPEHALL